MRIINLMPIMLIWACSSGSGEHNKSGTRNDSLKKRPSDSLNKTPDKPNDDMNNPNVEDNNPAVNDDQLDGAGYGAWEDAGDGIKIRRNLNMEKAIGGTKYVHYSSYSSGSSGGTTSESKVQLCSDLTLTAYDQSSVSVYVDGADGNSSSVESDEGTWQFYEDKQGNQFLKLNLKKKGQAYIVYRKEGSKVRLGNTLYHVTSADCR